MQDVSSAPLTFGLNGILCDLFLTRFQSTSSKNGCYIISSASETDPILLDGSLSSKLVNKLVASLLKYYFIGIGFSTISFSIYYLSLL